MTVIEGVRGHLLALHAISTLVAARIYPLRLPQKAVMPSIVLTLVDDPEIATHLRGPGNLFTARVQVDSWEATRDKAVTLGLFCRQRMNGFRGRWAGTGSPVPVIAVSAIRFEDDREIFEEEILGGLCRHSADYFVTYRRSEEEILAFSS